MVCYQDSREIRPAVAAVAVHRRRAMRRVRIRKISPVNSVVANCAAAAPRRALLSI